MGLFDLAAIMAGTTRRCWAHPPDWLQLSQNRGADFTCKSKAAGSAIVGGEQPDLMVITPDRKGGGEHALGRGGVVLQDCYL